MDREKHYVGLSSVPVRYILLQQERPDLKISRQERNMIHAPRMESPVLILHSELLELDNVVDDM